MLDGFRHGVGFVHDGEIFLSIYLSIESALNVLWDYFKGQREKSPFEVYTSYEEEAKCY